MPNERTWRNYLGDVPKSWRELNRYVRALAKSPSGKIIRHNLFSRECRLMPNRAMRHSPNVDKSVLVDFLNELGNDIGGIAALEPMTPRELLEITKDTAEKFATKFFVMGVRKPNPNEECDAIMPLRKLGERYSYPGYADLPAVGTNSIARTFQYLIDRGRQTNSTSGFRLQERYIRPECITPTWVYNRSQLPVLLNGIVSNSSPNDTAAMRDILGLTYSDRNWVRISYPGNFFLNPPTGVKVANPTFIDGGHDLNFRPRVFRSVSDIRGWGETVNLRSSNYQAGIEEAVHTPIQVHPDGFDLENLPPCELDAVDVNYHRLLKASKSEVR